MPPVVSSSHVTPVMQMERNLARHMLQEVKQAVTANEMARANSLQELKTTLMRDKSASEVREPAPCHSELPEAHSALTWKPRRMFSIHGARPLLVLAAPLLSHFMRHCYSGHFQAHEDLSR